MFYLLAITAVAAYSLQNTLLVKQAREMDGLSLAFYRNASFIITLLPLLLGSTQIDIITVLSHWRVLTFSGIAGGVYLALLYTAYRFLPVGITLVTTKAVKVIALAWAGWLFFGEVITASAMLIIGVIVLMSIYLALQRAKHVEITVQTGIGFAIAIVSSIPLSITHFSLAVLTRQASPLTAGYFWEVSIAISCGVLILCRYIFSRKKLQPVSGKAFRNIALRSAPTLIGTGCFGLAVSMGPISIANAIASVGPVFSTLLAWKLYGEKLSGTQWIGIVAVVVGILCLKIVM